MFNLNRKEARLVVLQRIELINTFIKKIRKLFGRYIFSNIISRFFLKPDIIGKAYYDNMIEEFKTIETYIDKKNKNILSIGGGLGGLELIINQKFDVDSFCFIERNYVSQKVKYGWDSRNKEAYNNLDLQKKFLIRNGMSLSKFNIFDYDKDQLPNKSFDIIVSLFSLDYHYDFNIYLKYLKKNSHIDTKIIFDTVRPDYFKNIFKIVNVIGKRNQIVHTSSRVVCSNFLN
jgi:hypothetical protein